MMLITLYGRDGEPVHEVNLPELTFAPGAIVYQSRCFVAPNVAEDVRAAELKAGTIAYIETLLYVAPDAD